MKYDDIKPMKDRYGFEFADKYHMLGEEKQPCRQCGCDTRAIDVFSEQHICSEECQHKFDEEIESIINSREVIVL